MAVAHDIHGVVHKNGTATLLARAVGATGSAITQATVESIAYTIYKLDEHTEDTWTAVTLHTAIAVAVASAVFDTLQDDELWDVDSTGYNFRWTPDISTNAAFEVAGATYLVDFSLTPTSGQVIHVRFLLACI